MRNRQLGNPTDKAWVAGWDAGVIGVGYSMNPYRRRPQAEAWKAGRGAGWRSNDDDVRQLKQRIAKLKD